MRFADKTALVTGGGSGIGAAIAWRLAHEGARVLVVDIDGQAASQVATNLSTHGLTAVARTADVSVADQVQAALHDCVERFGTVNVLVNNAGVGGEGLPLTQLEEAEWDRVIRINLRGVFLGCKYGLPMLAASGGGAIVNMGSSTAGWDTLWGGGAYMASKEAVLGLTRNAALEGAAYGVRVNAVCPGIVETALSVGQASEDHAFSSEKWHRYFERFAQRIPLRQVGQPEDVAAAVAFLACDEARHITGATLLVDGGQTLQSWSNAPAAEAYPRLPASVQQQEST